MTQLPLLLLIVLSSLLGGVLSVLAAAFFAFSARAAWIPLLVSYAIGALLGAGFLEILPHALEQGASAEGVMIAVLLGILGFFVLEKLVIWRHCHSEACEAHGAPSHDHGRSGLMIMVGDTFHNFVDGVIIAGAFLSSVELGIITALAIIAHEIPQEVGDFMILLHSGYRKRTALMFNLVSSAATLVGGVVAYFALQSATSWIPYLLGVAAASMIYVAVADLIPGLHKQPEIHITAQQVSLIGAGVASIWLIERLLGSLV